MSRSERTICVFHEVERGLGHRDVDADFAARAEVTAPDDLRAMLSVERELGLSLTYCVVGLLLPEVRESIQEGRHEIAFHSFDHDLEQPQLARCRALDPTVAGYRPPRSELTAELTDVNLARYGFRWILNASSEGWPGLEDGIVKIPVLLDDFPLHARNVSYRRWERKALQRVRKTRFAALGLHDCYARFWLPHYRGLLQKLSSLGELVTVGAVAERVAADHEISERWRVS
jgi:hypothetical protein